MADFSIYTPTHKGSCKKTTNCQSLFLMLQKFKDDTADFIDLTPLVLLLECAIKDILRLNGLIYFPKV